MLFSRNLYMYGAFSLVQLLMFVTAPMLPVSFGWENGPIENAQVILLIGGAVLALRYRDAAPTKNQKIFWLIIAPLWFVMAVRELSWGAVFYTPLSFDIELGPQFSSSQQLWYKPAVAPVLASLALALVCAFFYSKQYRTVIKLFKQSNLPITELIIFAVLMISAAAAEGHMGLHLGMDKGNSQIYEEAVELLAYGALLFAQFRVMKGLAHTSSEKAI